MPNMVVKNNIKHPTTKTGEVLNIATEYAAAALKTLSGKKVLDVKLRQKVKSIIEEKFSKPEHEPFRRLIDLFYVQSKKMKEVHKILGISLTQAYDWRREIELVVADELYVAKVLCEKHKKEIIEILKEGRQHVL